MRKARTARNKPAAPRRNGWLKGSENADKEDVRDASRNEIVNALPTLVRALLLKAKDGSAVHMKLLIQLERDLAEPEPDEGRGKNLEEILMEQWAKDAANEHAG